VNEHRKAQFERYAIEKIRMAYNCFQDPYDRDALGHARALCLDAVDCLEIALGIDDESQALRLWDKRFKKPSDG
jgi:hypothetical protein